MKTRTRTLRAALAAAAFLFAAAASSAPPARADVALTFLNATATTVAPGGSFSFTLSLSSTTEQLVGHDYFLLALGGGAGGFRLTARDLSLSPYSVPTTGDSIVFAGNNALLTGADGPDLGATIPGNGSPQTGAHNVATFTVQALGTLAPGFYQIATDRATAADLDGNTLPSDTTFLAPAIFTVNVVPEPGSAALTTLGLGGALVALAWLRRGWRRTV